MLITWKYTILRNEITLNNIWNKYIEEKKLNNIFLTGHWIIIMIKQDRERDRKQENDVNLIVRNQENKHKQTNKWIIKMNIK